jgi:hypothetical protein
VVFFAAGALLAVADSASAGLVAVTVAVGCAVVAVSFPEPTKMPMRLSATTAVMLPRLNATTAVMITVGQPNSFGFGGIGDVVDAEGWTGPDG